MEGEFQLCWHQLAHSHGGVMVYSPTPPCCCRLRWAPAAEDMKLEWNKHCCLMKNEWRIQKYCEVKTMLKLFIKLFLGIAFSGMLMLLCVDRWKTAKEFHLLLCVFNKTRHVFLESKKTTRHPTTGSWNYLKCFVVASSNDWNTKQRKNTLCRLRWRKMSKSLLIFIFYSFI